MTVGDVCGGEGNLKIIRKEFCVCMQLTSNNNLCAGIMIVCAVIIIFMLYCFLLEKTSKTEELKKIDPNKNCLFELW